MRRLCIEHAIDKKVLGNHKVNTVSDLHHYYYYYYYLFHLFPFPPLSISFGMPLGKKQREETRSAFPSEYP